MTPSEFLRVSLDPVRLCVLGHAADGSLDLEQVASGLGVRHRRVRKALGRLRSAGLVTADGRLNTAQLRELAAGLPRAEIAAPDITDGEWTAEEREILSRFFEGDRLREIPGPRSKRLVILERLCQEFEPGIRYPEREVNFILQLFYPDYAALRRDLVDEGLMTRADGVYWRTGGRFPQVGGSE